MSALFDHVVIALVFGGRFGAEYVAVVTLVVMSRAEAVVHLYGSVVVKPVVAIGICNPPLKRLATA